MRAVLFLVLAAFAAPPLHAQQVVAEPFPPAKFSSLTIERDDSDGSTVTIQLQGDTLLYQSTKGGKGLENLTLHPSDDDWFAFIQALNGPAKVYQWSPKYEYPGQGTSWAIALVLADRKFQSEGVNEFPMEGSVAQPQANPASGPSVPFQLFWQAVLKLAGKAPAASK
jgi:hypothetical protein